MGRYILFQFSVSNVCVKINILFFKKICWDLLKINYFIMGIIVLFLNNNQRVISLFVFKFIFQFSPPPSSSPLAALSINVYIDPDCELGSGLFIPVTWHQSLSIFCVNSTPDNCLIRHDKSTMHAYL